MSVLLNYHDAILYDSDVAILTNSSGWLNDQCIHFFEKILEYDSSFHEIDGSNQIIGSPGTNISTNGALRFIDPSVVSFMKLQCTDDDEFQDLACGLNLQPNENIVFLPVNDSSVLEEGNCSHWSLLVLFIKQKQGFHFDSMSGMGAGVSSSKQPSKQFRQAVRTAEAFQQVLRW